MAFISFEGTEGSGKSTQIDLLARHLRGHGLRVTTTREPGGTALGDRLREILLESSEPLTDVTEAYLMTAARAEHVRRVIRPALQDGEIVLCDRFLDSTLAYQGAGRQLPVAKVAALQDLAVDATLPDLTILLDVPVEVGLARRTSGGGANRIDREHAAFHERVVAWYRQAARDDPVRWKVIDATAPLAVVHTHVTEVVCPFVGLSRTDDLEKSRT